METFTIGLGDQWWFRALGRHPLVRRSDRIEALALVLTVLLTVVALPIAGAIGTSVYDVRSRLYAEEAQTKHQVIATAIEDGTVGVNGDNKSVFTGEAAWSVAGQPHTGVVEWLSTPKSGAQQSIWIDTVGNKVAPPSSSSRAAADGVGIAISIWFGVVSAAAGLLYVVRRWLDRRRYAEWDREFNESRDNDRRKHQP